MTIANEHVIVVGGSTGIGLSTAQSLLAEGARVTITGRSTEKLDAARKTLANHGDALSVAAFDAADVKQAAAFFERAGAFDHLVLSFGSGRGLGPFRDLDLIDVRRGFEEKVWPHLHCTQAALRTMRADGSVTFVAAVSAEAAMPGTAGLAASNGVLTTLTPLLASELRPLRVNAVSPGVIDTPWWDFVPGEQRQAIFANYASMAPVGRIGLPDDIARAIGFLIRDGFMTGHVLTCDGGLRLRPAA